MIISFLICVELWYFNLELEFVFVFVYDCIDCYSWIKLKIIKKCSIVNSCNQLSFVSVFLYLNSCLSSYVLLVNENQGAFIKPTISYFKS